MLLRSVTKAEPERVFHSVDNASHRATVLNRLAAHLHFPSACPFI